MGQKPKAGGAKKPPAKKPKMTQKEQSERFIETARGIGVDETGMEFERLLARIVHSKNER